MGVVSHEVDGVDVGDDVDVGGCGEGGECGVEEVGEAAGFFGAEHELEAPLVVGACDGGGGRFAEQDVVREVAGEEFVEGFEGEGGARREAAQQRWRGAEVRSRTAPASSLSPSSPSP